MNITWTAADDATLVKMIGEGVSASIIAKRLCRSRSSVCGRAHRKYLHFKSHIRQPIKRAEPAKTLERFTAAEDKVITEMAAAGKSGFDIGQAINRHKSSVVKRARLLGAKLKGKDGPKPSPKPKAPEVKVPFAHVTPSVPVVPLMVALVDLRPNMCRFPCGDPLKEGFGFCGLHTDGTYCKPHARLCYTRRRKCGGKPHDDPRHALQFVPALEGGRKPYFSARPGLQASERQHPQSSLRRASLSICACVPCPQQSMEQAAWRAEKLCIRSVK